MDLRVGTRTTYQATGDAGGTAADPGSNLELNIHTVFQPCRTCTNHVFLPCFSYVPQFRPSWCIRCTLEQRNTIAPSLKLGTTYIPCHTLPYPTLSYLPYSTRPYPTLPHPTLPYPTLPYPTLSTIVYTAIPYPTLPYPTLPYPTLPTLLYPAIPYPTLPYPVLLYLGTSACSHLLPPTISSRRNAELLWLWQIGCMCVTSTDNTYVKQM